MIAKPRFEPVWNYGHVLQAVVIAAAAIGSIVYHAQWQARTDKDIATISAAQTRHETLLTPLLQSQVLQDERIAVLSAGQAEARKSASEIASQLNAIRVDFADVKARIIPR